MTEPRVSSAPPSGEGIEAEAQAISAMARGLAVEIERGRRLPDALLGRLRDSGLLRAGAPHEVGGLELAPGAALRCRRGDRPRRRVDRLVRVDRDHQQPARRVPARRRPHRAVRRRAGDRGRRLGAERQGPAVAGGVVVSGRWAFCSGITHADLLFAGCFLEARRTGRRSSARGRAWSPCARTTSRSTTPGTRSACAAPAVTMPPPPTCSCRTGSCSRCSTDRSSTVRSTASPSSGSSRSRSAPPRWATRAPRSRSSSGSRPSRSARDRNARSPSGVRRNGRSPRPTRHCARRAPSTTTRSTPRGKRHSTTRPSPSSCATIFAWRPRTRSGRRPRSCGRCTTSAASTAIYDDVAAATALPRRAHCHRALPGQRGVAGAPRPHPAGPAGRHHDAVSRRIEGVLPFWLDRPDPEALDIALAVRRAGLDTLWIGEMATFDAFALATAIGLRAPGLRPEDRAARDRRAQPGFDRARRLLGRRR